MSLRENQGCFGWFPLPFRKRRVLDMLEELEWIQRTRICLGNYNVDGWGMREMEAELKACWKALGLRKIIKICREEAVKKDKQRAMDMLEEQEWEQTAQTCLQNYSVNGWGMQEVEAKLTQCCDKLGVRKMIKICQEYDTKKVERTQAQPPSEVDPCTDEVNKLAQVDYADSGWRAQCKAIKARLQARVGNTETNFQLVEKKNTENYVNVKPKLQKIATKIEESEEGHLAKMAAEILADEDSHLSKVAADMLAAAENSSLKEENILTKMTEEISTTEDLSVSKMAAEILKAQDASLSKMAAEILTAEEETRSKIAVEILAAGREKKRERLIAGDNSIDTKLHREKKSFLQKVRRLFAKTKPGEKNTEKKEPLRKRMRRFFKKKSGGKNASDS